MRFELSWVFRNVSCIGCAMLFGGWYGVAKTLALAAVVYAAMVVLLIASSLVLAQTRFELAPHVTNLLASRLSALGSQRGSAVSFLDLGIVPVVVRA